MGCFCTSRPERISISPPNAKGVDALVAGGLLCTRANDLPVIVLRSVIDGPQRLAIGRETEKIETAISVQVGRVEDGSWTRNWLRRGEIAFLVAKPHESARSVGVRRRRYTAKQQIDCAVVIQISGAQAYFAGEKIVSGGNMGDLDLLPGLAIGVLGETDDCAIGLDAEQIENSAVAHIGGCDRSELACDG